MSEIKSAESTDWSHPTPFKNTDWTKEDTARLNRGRETVTFTETIEHLDPYVAKLAEAAQSSKTQGIETEVPQIEEQPVEVPQVEEQPVEVAQSESKLEMQAEHSLAPEAAEALARIHAARAQEQSLSHELER